MSHIKNRQQGRKVMYTGLNGTSYEQSVAREFLNVGDILTIKETYVGGSSSSVVFMELPDREFNTVMFKDFNGQKEVYYD